MQAKENATNRLGEESVGKLLFRLSVPAITAQLVNVLYNIVDRAFIGQIEGIGKDALAGVGVTMPILMLISAFASLVGMGGAPLASIRMGAGDDEGAENILGNCMTMLLTLGALLTIVFLALRRPMLYWFGASDVTIVYALQYMTVYVSGTLFVMITLGMNAFINTQGFASVGMWTVLIGAALNIILDPIFIFAFRLGVQGAALATILSQGVSCVWVLCFLFGKRTHLRVRPRFLLLKGRIVGRVMALGASPFVMQSTESLVQITINTGLAAYSGDLAVASMTIITSVLQVMNMPLMGLGQGAQPIISYNFGAGNMARVRRTFRLLITTSLSIAAAFWLLVQLCPQVFVSIFNSDPDLMGVTVRAMRIFLAGMIGMGAQFAIQQTFMAVGQAKLSIFIALLRKVILLIPLALILPHVMGLGAMGIYIAEPIADLTCATIAVLIFASRYRKLFGDGALSNIQQENKKTGVAALRFRER